MKTSLIVFVVLCLAFFQPDCWAGQTENWYAPRAVIGVHDNPDFSFLEGTWQSADKKFTENWSRDANGGLIGLRTFVGKKNEEECYLFAFVGTPVGTKVNFRHFNERLEYVSPPNEHIIGSCKALVAHKGSITCRSDNGFRTTSEYDCPNNDVLNIAIETDSIKSKVHLLRVR